MGKGSPSERPEGRGKRAELNTKGNCVLVRLAAAAAAVWYGNGRAWVAKSAVK